MSESFIFLDLATAIESILRQFSANTVINYFIISLIIVFLTALTARIFKKLPAFVSYSPNLLTTLGILGTFVGIVIGLLAFDVADIDGSMGALLDGLKTAFITSLMGIFFAILFKVLDGLFFAGRGLVTGARKSIGPEEIHEEIKAQRAATERLARCISGDEDATLLTQLQKLRHDTRDEGQKIREALNSQEKCQSSMLGYLRSQDEKIQDFSKNLLHKLETSNQQLENYFSAQEVFSQRLFDTLNTSSAQLEQSVSEQKRVYELLSTTMADQSEKLDNFSNRLFTVLDDSESLVQQSLAKQDDLREALVQSTQQQAERFDVFSEDLWNKLDQVSEMLSKSATEQVINALKEVIADFNNNLTEQFGDNFKHLNASVDELIEWQRNYKDQLMQMIEQYRLGVESIEQTRTAVTSISEESKQIPLTMESLKTILEMAHHQLAELELHLATFTEMRDRAVEAVPQIREQINLMVTGVTEATQEVGQQMITASRESSEIIISGAKDFGGQVYLTNEQLKTASSELVNQRQAVIEDLEKTRQSVFESVNKAGLEILKAANDASTVVTQGAKEMESGIQKASEDLVKKSDQISKGSEKIHQHVEASINKINEELKKMVTEISSGNKVVGETLVKANKDLEVHVKEVQYQVEDSIETMQKRLESMLNEMVSENKKAFESAAKRTEILVVNEINAIDEQRKKDMEYVMSRMAEALGEIAGKFVKDYRELTEAMGEVVKEVNKFNEDRNLYS